MTPILVYILKVNGLLLVLYLFYKVFLQRDTFVRANRVYFLGGIVLSILLPFLTYTSIVRVEVEPLDTAQYANLLEEVSIDTIATVENSWTVEDTYTAFSYLYISLTLMSVLWLCYKVIKLTSYIHSLPVSELDSALRIDTKSSDAYSFMKWVILPKDYQSMDQLDVVLAHEQVHVKQMHSVDLLIVQILKHVFWFNPVLYLLQREVNLNLEYIVDEQITREYDIYGYQRALVLYESSKEGYTPMVNTFGASDLKKRIIMLNNPKSTNMKRLKYVLLSPVLGVFFFLFQTEIQAQYIEMSTTDAKATNQVTIQDDAILEEVAKGDEEAKRLGEEVNNIGEEAKKLAKEAKKLAKEAKEIGEGIPYIVNGFVYSYNEFTALGNPVSSLASMDVIDAETANKRYGEVGKNGAIVVKLKPDTEWTNKGSFMDGARNVGYASGTTSYTLSLQDKEGNTIEAKTYKSRGEADKAMESGIKKLDEEARKKEREARREELYTRLASEKEEALKAQNKMLEEMKSRKAAKDNLDLRLVERRKKLTEGTVIDGENVVIVKSGKRGKGEFVYYVNGKLYDESNRHEAEALIEKSGAKGVRVYNKKAATDELGYTGNGTVLGFTLKTDDDRANEAKVEVITKKYKEKVFNDMAKVQNSNYKGVVYINGVKKSAEDLKNISSDKIVTIDILKDDTAVERYGEVGKNGVVLVRVKP